MTREEFIKVLDNKNYTYEIQGNKVVVTYEWGVYLHSLSSLPPGVEFSNGGGVYLSSLISLPSDIVFSNRGYVWFSSIESLSRSVEFRNDGHVNLEPLIRGMIDDWKGNIEGIYSTRLLNLMIKQGVFER
jgi:hypothetical protein